VVLNWLKASAELREPEVVMALLPERVADTPNFTPSSLLKVVPASTTRDSMSTWRMGTSSSLTRAMISSM